MLRFLFNDIGNKAGKIIFSISLISLSYLNLFMNSYPEKFSPYSEAEKIGSFFQIDSGAKNNKRKRFISTKRVLISTKRVLFNTEIAMIGTNIY